MNAVMGLLALVVASVFGNALRQAFQATEARRHRLMFGWYSLGLLALLVLTIPTIAIGDVSVPVRIVVLGIVGATAGASIAIWLGYLAHDHFAPSNQKESPVPPKSDAPPPGAVGNFSIGQQGGTVNQTYINQAPQRLNFTAEIGRELISLIPKGAINLNIIGSETDRRIGMEFAAFLNSSGYQILTTNLIGTMSPPPEKPLQWDPTTVTLQIAPSAR